MRVWVVESGEYENFGMTGIYASLEAAKRDNPITADMRRRFPEAEWIERDGEWYNGAKSDWDTTIRPVEVRDKPTRCEVCRQGGAFRRDDDSPLLCSDHWLLVPFSIINYSF